jgi:uncharacterized membrane protein (DUF4010 family)
MALRLAPGMAVLGAAGLAVAYLMGRLARRGAQRASVAARGNPFELGSAIRFGLLFGVVTFAAHAAQVWAGDTGLYLAGGLAGLTDVDAIALSMARLAHADPAKLGVATLTVTIAVLSNTLVKLGITVALGAPELRRRMLPIAGALAAAGAAAALAVGAS